MKKWKKLFLIVSQTCFLYKSVKKVEQGFAAQNSVSMLRASGYLRYTEQVLCDFFVGASSCPPKQVIQAKSVSLNLDIMCCPSSALTSLMLFLLGKVITIKVYKHISVQQANFAFSFVNENYIHVVD